MSEGESNQPRAQRVPVTSISVCVDPQGESHRGLVKDLSKSGIFINTRDPLPVDSKVEIQLIVPEHEEPLLLPGRVARIALDSTTGEQVIAGIGVCFVGLDVETQKALAQIVLELQASDADPTDEEAEKSESRLRSQIEYLEEQIEELCEELEHYKQEDDTSSGLVNNLKAQIASLQARAIDGLGKYRKTEQSLQQQRDRAAEDLRYRRELRDQIESLVLGIETVQAEGPEVRDALQIVEEFESKVSAASDRTVQLEEELSAAQLDLEARVQRVQHSVEEARTANDEVCEDIDRANSDIDKILARQQHRTHRVLAELLDEQGHVEVAAHKITALEEKLERRRRVFKKVKAQAADLRRMLASVAGGSDLANDDGELLRTIDGIPNFEDLQDPEPADSAE